MSVTGRLSLCPGIQVRKDRVTATHCEPARECISRSPTNTTQAQGSHLPGQSSCLWLRLTLPADSSLVEKGLTFALVLGLP